MNKVLYFYIGTVAELIKLSSVFRKLQENKIPFRIIESGQNDLNFRELKPIIDIQKADIVLESKSKESSPLKFVFWATKTFFMSLKKLNGEFKRAGTKNIYLIVYGDTISALIGALVAKFYKLKLIHIEAGYRSFNFFEPFPEEITRVLISFFADVHFCPDGWSLNNIKRHKGIKISTGENTLFETCMQVAGMKTKSRILDTINKSKFFLLVLHRQEHMLYKKNLTKKYIEAVTSLANQKLKCVFVLHKLTRNFLKEQNLLDYVKRNPNIMIIPRLPYLEFLKIMDGAEFIATDGGSNQNEAYFLGKPCLLLRKCTEQMEGIGTNIVLAKDNIEIVNNFLLNYKKYKRNKIKLGIKPSTIIADFFLKND